MPQQMPARQRRLRALRRKQVRKNERNRLRNQSARSAIKTALRHLDEALAAHQHQEALQRLRQIERLLDKAQVRGIVHRNTVARTKSRLHHRVQKTFAAATETV